MYTILLRRCYRETQVHKWFSKPCAQMVVKPKKWQWTKKTCSGRLQTFQNTSLPLHLSERYPIPPYCTELPPLKMLSFRMKITVNSWFEALIKSGQRTENPWSTAVVTNLNMLAVTQNALTISQTIYLKQ